MTHETKIHKKSSKQSTSNNNALQNAYHVGCIWNSGLSEVTSSEQPTISATRHHYYRGSSTGTKGTICPGWHFAGGGVLDSTC